MRLGLLLAALPLVLATGCGDDGGNDNNGQDSAGGASVPSCDDFKGGAEIPDDFEGCMSDADTVEAAISYDCDDGRTLVAAGPIFGFKGEQAVYVDGGGDSPQFQDLLAECRP